REFRPAFHTVRDLAGREVNDLSFPGGHIVIQKPASHITSVATNFHHTCALSNEGQVYCWGQNIYGELGHNNTVPEILPTPIDNTYLAPPDRYFKQITV